MHTEDGPLIVPVLAARLTAIIFVELNVPQPLETVYVIVAFPVDMPVTTPVVASTVATDGVTLVQVPPAEPLLVYGVVDPIHNVEAPLTVPAFKTGFTVMLADAVNVPQGVWEV